MKCKALLTGPAGHDTQAGSPAACRLRAARRAPQGRGEPASCRAGLPGLLQPRMPTAAGTGAEESNLKLFHSVFHVGLSVSHLCNKSASLKMGSSHVCPSAFPQKPSYLNCHFFYSSVETWLTHSLMYSLMSSDIHVHARHHELKSINIHHSLKCPHAPW